MKLKTRIVLTSITIISYILARASWCQIESPLRGIATANQLNDTLESYAVFNSISNNGIETVLFLILILVLSCIWWNVNKKDVN